ncbi:hypothetical protein [Mucilaginibacter sp.]|uniref:hypothetical protein n=1 Tax=Mucilaginibacter sp. TaxID=1882438 RepID=UPI0025E8F6B0|nr:hypothetical protein [Mucilaginibacter sp.]
MKEHWPAQLPREGCYFCLDTKVTKKSSQQIGFFAAQASALQTGQNHGLLNLASTSFALGLPFGNVHYAPPAHYPTKFCPLSPETYLLTGRETTAILILLIPVQTISTVAENLVKKCFQPSFHRR